MGKSIVTERVSGWRFVISWFVISRLASLLLLLLHYLCISENRRYTGQNGAVYRTDAGQNGAVFRADAGQNSAVYRSDAGQNSAVYRADAGRNSATYTKQMQGSACTCINIYIYIFVLIIKSACVGVLKFVHFIYFYWLSCIVRQQPLHVCVRQSDTLACGQLQIDRHRPSFPYHSFWHFLRGQAHAGFPLKSQHCKLYQIFIITLWPN